MTTAARSPSRYVAAGADTVNAAPPAPRTLQARERAAAAVAARR